MNERVRESLLSLICAYKEARKAQKEIYKYGFMNIVGSPADSVMEIHISSDIYKMSGMETKKIVTIDGWFHVEADFADGWKITACKRKEELTDTEMALLRRAEVA
ncbi:hypothetical protein TAMA11512_08930 [Selenomonas sp. TAMA-11512]|uniref:hypothetical protein n=1 Tax=Selenomonas sp. TAMA-11512 TaxID=3095337 RepID=UPI0030937C9E|nr:hypothetical protein TAMA11512_08930 [Selenomonas sp. TAMA-11512]